MFLCWNGLYCPVNDAKNEFCGNKTNLRLLQSFLGNEAAAGELQALEQKLLAPGKKDFVVVRDSNVKVNQHNINFCFDYNWHLKSIKIGGTHPLNQELEQLYLLHMDEQFSLSKHHETLKKLKEQLDTWGFLRAKIADRIDLNWEQKTVHVKLDVIFGKSLHIKTININYSGLLPQKLVLLKARINRLCHVMLHKKCFQTSIVENCMSKIRDLLLNSDLIGITLTTDFIPESEQLNVTFNCQTGLVAALNNAQEFLDKHDAADLSPALARALNQDLLDNGLLGARMRLYPNATLTVEPTTAIKIIDCKIVFKATEQRQLQSLGLQCPELGGQILGKKLVDQHCHELQKMLLKNGYWKAAVKAETVHYNNAAVGIIFHVNANAQHFLQQVEITLQDCPKNSLHKRISQILKAHTFFKVPQIANPFTIEKHQQLLLSLLHEEGFLAAQVTVKTTQQPADNGNVGIKAEFVVGLGQKPTFGPIEICNRTNIPSKKIRHKIQCVPGQEWSLNRLQTSIKNIENMHLFKNVSFAATPQVDANGKLTIPITLSTEQDKPREFCAKFGGSILGSGIKNHISIDDLNFTCNASCQYTLKNPLLLADFFQTTLSVSQSQQTADINYYCPQLLDLPVDSKLAIFVGRTAFQEYLTRKTLDVNDFVARAGLCAALSSTPQNYGTWQLCVGIEGICPPTLTRRHPENWTGYWFIGPNYCLNKIYSTWANRIGNSFNFAMQLVMPLSKQGGFVRTLLQDTIFIPIGGIACVALEFGVEQNQGLNNSVYPELIVRQQHDMAQKHAVFFPALSDRYDFLEQKQLVWDVLRQGQEKIFSVKAELRMRLFSSLAVVGYQALRFVDHIGFLPVSGAGIRYTTPFGMLCLDVAAKWNSGQNLAQSCAWRLTLGQAF